MGWSLMLLPVLASSEAEAVARAQESLQEWGEADLTMFEVDDPDLVHAAISGVNITTAEPGPEGPAEWAVLGGNIVEGQDSPTVSLTPSQVHEVAAWLSSQDLVELIASNSEAVGARYGGPPDAAVVEHLTLVIADLVNMYVGSSGRWIIKTVT